MITIVTGNNKKFAEMEEALAHHNIAVTRADIDIDEIQETDQERIVRDKVQQAFARVQGPVLVDDSGIYFDRYPNFPGMNAKFIYKALGFAGLARLIDEGDTGRFKTSVAYMDETLEQPQIFWGTYPGALKPPPESSSLNEEMPYALFFQPDGESVVMSEMTPAQRANDHRHQALNNFVMWYTQR